MTLIGVVGEDEGHFRVATALIDQVLTAEVAWLHDILDSCRTWGGLEANERWYKYSPDDGHDVRPFTIDGVTIKPQGRIAGEPLKPDAGMWRKALLLLCHRDPPPDVVVLVRDLDGHAERRAGIKQVCTGLPWPFPIAVASPEPEIEGWIISGFQPADPRERATLDQLRRELSFDPTLQSQRLTSRPNDAATDAKRVLSRLCNGDRDREAACLQHAILHERGEHNWARAFLDDVQRLVVPAFRGPA